MGTKSPKDDTSTMQPVHSPAVLLLGTIADTSWRMFVPTIACILAGVWVDDTFGSKPFGLAAGVLLGFVLAGMLVSRQLQGGKK